MEDAIFLIIKDIPLIGGGAIKKGEHIHRINGIYYSEFGPYDVDIQRAWQSFFKRSDWHKWVQRER